MVHSVHKTTVKGCQYLSLRASFISLIKGPNQNKTREKEYLFNDTSHPSQLQGIYRSNHRPAILYFPVLRYWPCALILIQRKTLERYRIGSILLHILPIQMFTCSNFLSLIENTNTILYYDASVARKKEKNVIFQ